MRECSTFDCKSNMRWCCTPYANSFFSWPFFNCCAAAVTFYFNTSFFFFTAAFSCYFPFHHFLDFLMVCQKLRLAKFSSYFTWIIYAKCINLCLSLLVSFSYLLQLFCACHSTCYNKKHLHVPYGHPHSIH